MNYEIEDEQEKIYQKRMKDLNGWFSESLVEHHDLVMVKLRDLILTKDKLKIGAYVLSMVEEYCTPDKEEAIESLHGIYEH